MRAKEKERRSEIRFNVSGQLPISIYSLAGDQLAYHVIDVSRSGFGIVLPTEVSRGSQLFLDVADYKKVPFRVIWTVAEALNDEEPDAPLFRCGLSTSHQRIDLIELLAKRSNVFLQTKD